MFACVNFFSLIGDQLSAFIHSFTLLFIFVHSTLISVCCTGRIFTIFPPNGRYLVQDSRFDLLFPMTEGTLPWQPILWPNWLTHFHLFIHDIHFSGGPRDVAVVTN